MEPRTPPSQAERSEQEAAANELLASVDLAKALEFINNNQHRQQPRLVDHQAQAHATSPDTKTTPTQQPPRNTAEPSSPQPEPSSTTTSPARNQRLKTISISILRSVARKRDFSAGPHPAIPSDQPAIHSLPPALQSILSDHHHHPNELTPAKRPFFIVDVRSVTAAAERHQANPNQIRRVEECKRFFSLRYEPIFTTLAEGKPPPSLVKVVEWRRKLQLVSILRQKREESFRSTSQASAEQLRRAHDEPSSAEELRLKLRMTTIDPPSLLSTLSPQQNKWICLSSRKRRTMWEICPEDIQAYMATQGMIEDEEELREAERLFGQFDEHPVRHHKSSRQRVNSSNKSASRWFSDAHVSTGQLSDHDSTRSPHSGQGSFHSQTHHHHHLRKPSSGTSSSRAIRADGSTSYAETSSSLPRVSNLTNYRYSSDMSSQDKYPRLHQTSSDLEEREPHAGSSQPNPEDLSLDVHNLSWSGKTPVSSPHVSSAIPLSPLEKLHPRGSANLLSSSSAAAAAAVLPDDYHTPPHSQAKSPSTAPPPARHSSDYGPRPSKPALVKSKVKKYHSAWSATDDNAHPPAGSSPLRSNSQPHVVDPSGLARHSKQRLTSLGHGLTTTSHPTAAHHHPGSSPEKPNLSRAASAKGLLHFAKRSIIPDLPSAPGPSLGPSVLAPTARPSKLAFFHKPPRDWRGWKFDKSHLLFRTSNDKKQASPADLFPPVNDILFVSPFHQPLRTPNHLPRTGLHSFAASQQTVNLPILMTDLTDEEAQEIEMLVVMLASQVEHSALANKQNREEYRKHAGLLPDIRQEIGLEAMPIRMAVAGGDRSEGEGGKEESGKDKRAGQPGSSSSSSSTTTEGSVLSQSVLHDDPDDTSPGALVQLSADRLAHSLARIELTLADLDNHKQAFRLALRSQILARTTAIQKHEVFLASCSQRQELMRKDRDLVNQMKRTVKVFGQEGRMVDHFKQALTNGISRPLISLLVSILTKLIGLGLKLFALHSAARRAPLRGLICALGVRWIYTVVWRQWTTEDGRLLALWARLPTPPATLGPYLAALRSLCNAARVLLVCVNFSLLLTSLCALLSALFLALLSPSSATSPASPPPPASIHPPNHLTQPRRPAALPFLPPPASSPAPSSTHTLPPAPPHPPNPKKLP
ncbi:hypothetical protein PtA15_3A567 [Puccinia triticina]|uniref:PX domain-containing protein n=1 Tax=Puccinia triticina TaxID=208348 RepID=A0ABY7CD96_9BASI|nr:uncharacterized protein PtA15_3A567 [Puccinia triticina]WAQ83198.1 hypothetical protein PtA15_3A567 [Puccinia triticina]